MSTVRSSSGTVHALVDAFATLCGAGLSDDWLITESVEKVTCTHCLAEMRRRERVAGGDRT